jgi:hypothetical protein
MELHPDTRISSAQGPLVREQEMLRFAARWNTPFSLSCMPAEEVLPNLPNLLGWVMRCYLMVFEAECRIIRRGLFRSSVSAGLDSLPNAASVNRNPRTAGTSQSPR